MTTAFKRAFFAGIGFVLMLLVSACGSTASTQTTTSAASTPTSAPQSTPTAASSALIQTAQATIDGKAETILTDAKGLTLYYFTPDLPSKLACTAACAQAWPPLLATDATSTPTSSTSLPGTLSVFTNANGNQVEYNGYLLYTYVKDSGPGQVTGQGVGGVWYIATPDVASYILRVTKATVSGKAEKIFTDAKGLPLYYYTPDSPTKLACAGGCAKAWPPLLTTGSDAPLADVPLTGKLTVFQNANGTQVEYNGHLLYTYEKDAPGLIKGQGLGGKWFIATPGLAA